MSGLGTFFGWRGARQGKLGVRAAQQTTLAVQQATAADRRRDLVAQGLIEFNATDREVAQVEARLAAERRERVKAEGRAAWDARRARWAEFKASVRPLKVWEFWVFAVLGVLSAVTLVGLPITALCGLLMWVRHPWREIAAAPAPLAIEDAPTVTLPVVTAPLAVAQRSGRHSR